MKTTDNTILITGGATGIGFAMAEAFVKAGNTVIICGRRGEKLEEARSKVPQLHTRVCDVSEDKQRVDLIGWTIKNFPGFNLLVNNAGIQNLLFFRQPVESSRITAEVTINLIAPVHLSNLVIPHFIGQKETAILNVSSGLGFVPIAVLPVYCSTKAALHSFSMSLRHQLKDTPIRVFEIIPPTVNTELDHGSRKKRGADPGIDPAIVAADTIRALATDCYECTTGQSEGLVKAAANPMAQEVFRRMNG
ncbi:MAG TPA: SDR family oxidoreductase [Bacteroidales bacterium]|nr:SDR family oxidoreductase [Bacteroidales bacterium]